MRKVNIKFLLPLVVLITFFSCTQRSKNPVVVDFDTKKQKGISYYKDNLSFNFYEDNVPFMKVLTKKKFTKYNLIFTPVKTDNLENPFTVLIYYINDNDYCRLNIFPDTWKIHLYKKDAKDIKNLLYTHLQNFNTVKEKNIFEVKLDNNILSLRLNENIFYNEKIDLKKGKVGVGAYGKRGETAKFIFRTL